MNLSLRLPLKHWWSLCAAAFARSLRAQVESTGERCTTAVELEVRPLRSACWMAATYATLQLACAVNFVLVGSRLIAVCVLLTAALSIWLLWRELLLRGPHGVRRLRLASDGSAQLVIAGGAVQDARVLPSSLYLGPVVLLLLQGARRYRLLLGPGNVDPVTLAALRRWLGVVPPAL